MHADPPLPAHHQGTWSLPMCSLSEGGSTVGIPDAVFAVGLACWVGSTLFGSALVGSAGSAGLPNSSS